MCRPTRLILILCAALATLVAPVRADEVAAYLERHGLIELLAVHLEQRLETAGDEERDELVVRLAGIYGQLLETVRDPARRLELEERSRNLLRAQPATKTDALRFALLRASYRAAEKSAENHRLGQSTEDDLEQARAAFTELIPELNKLAKRAEDDAEDAERRLGRAAGTDAIVLTEESERFRQLRAQCIFLSAWSLYYQSWLNDRPDNARAAQRLFAELLDFGSEPALPENVSVDLRSVEAIARCILGMALCRSLTSSTTDALQWLELLEHERAYEPLRNEAPAWRMAIYLENDEFINAQATLISAVDESGPAPLHWLRLLAVQALEAQDQSRHAANAARFAVTELAARGELKQVFDLAERYGVEALGDAGFAQRYVVGVLKYYEARALHDGEEPTIEPDVVQAYNDTIAELEAAQGERDRDQYPAALPDCARLIAWCHYFQGSLLAARDAFEIAAEQLPAEDAPEALWMAVVCLDRLVEADPENADLADRLAVLIGRFLDAYPASEHAPKLILRRAITSGEISPEAAEELLDIPPNSAVYDSARRRAAQILYRLFRESDAAQRIAWGDKYLSVAVPLFSLDEQNLDGADGPAVQRFIVRGRRILEVALHEGLGRLVPVRKVLSTFGGQGEETLGDLSAIEDELAYRALQERLLGDALDEAAAIADRLWTDDEQGIWARLASRAMFKHGNAMWRAAEESRGDDRRAVALVAKYGPRVLADFDDDAEAMDEPAVLAYYASVAEACMVIWQRSADEGKGAASLALYEKLLAARPRNAGFLRAAAILSEEYNKRSQALECWRTLVAGSVQASEAWYEAKFNVISLLARSDPPRAREVMDQHKLLNPEYGPDPWGARLRALDSRLIVDARIEETDDAAGEDDEARQEGRP